MCCFAQPILSVSDTNLFARLSTADSASQLLVYQMQFESQVQNAMILPLPVAIPSREDSVRFISLKHYDDFFKDLSRGFPSEAPPTRGFLPWNRMAPTADAQLVVHDVGDFVASFVPTLADFRRLDSQFVIPKESWEKLPEYSDYGFAVFQLKSLAGKPHPMAFEFTTRWPGRIFFPTVHIHDGEVHDMDQFDHVLYLQHPEFDRVVGTYRGPRTPDATTRFVRSKWPAQNFCKTGRTEGIVVPNQLVHRTEIRGLQRNQDVIRPVSFESSSRQVSGTNSTSSVLRHWPTALASIGLAGLLWLFRRRTLLRTQAERRDEAANS